MAKKVVATSVKKNTGRKSVSITPDRMNELIRVKAFEIYCRRGTKPGDELSDWQKAEKEVKKELGLR